MSMSSSDHPPATLRLRGVGRFDELTVVDASFRPVAIGIGALEAVLEPGIYEVVARAGPTIARRLIRLAPGGLRNETAPVVRFPSTAPIAGSAGEDSGLLSLVRIATAGVADRADSTAALCVVVRDPGHDGGGPIVGPGVLALMDHALHEVAEFGSGWQVSRPGSAMVWADQVKPGGYALRLGRAPDSLDLALWVPEGWTLVIFMAGDSPGGRVRFASVHLVRKGEAWGGGDEALATELCLWGLREGRSQAAQPAMRAIEKAGGAGPSPFAEIALAHLLLEGSIIDDRRVASIIDRLVESMPEHPDVIALQVAAAQRGVGLQRPARLPVEWPPMLLASYRALLRRDAAEVDAFAPGSVAERAAGSITAGNIWSTWRPVAPADRIPPRLSRTRVAPDRVLAKAARNPEKLRRPKYSDPATRRVAAYLNAVADLDEGRNRNRLANLSPAQIALATGLPTATVDLSLRRIWLSIAGVALLPFIITLSALVGALAVATFGVGLLTVGAPFPTRPAIASPSATLTLLPRIEVQPIELPAVPVGAQSAAEVVPISNLGDGPLTILNLVTAGEAAGEFPFEEDDCRPAPLDPGSQCIVYMTFTPKAVGDRFAELWVETQEIGVVAIGLHGTGTAPLRFEPSELVLGPGEGADVRIIAAVTIRIESLEIAGTDREAFGLTPSCKPGDVLQPDESCAMFVQHFRQAGAHAARIEVVLSDGSTWDMPIKGGAP